MVLIYNQKPLADFNLIAHQIEHVLKLKVLVISLSGMFNAPSVVPRNYGFQWTYYLLREYVRHAN